MTPNEIVQRFATLTATCLDILRSEYDGLEKQSMAQPAVLLPRDGSPPVNSGRIGSLGRFELHGRGCRFELDSGEDLDVDWDSEGRAVFDSWRILMFARSIGDDVTDRESLRAAADADPLLWEIREDWFTWADRNYDLHREQRP